MALTASLKTNGTGIEYPYRFMVEENYQSPDTSGTLFVSTLVFRGSPRGEGGVVVNSNPFLITRVSFGETKEIKGAGFSYQVVGE